MALIDDIAAGPVALDTVAFIYFLEEHPRFLPVVEPLFSAIARGRLRAVTSTLTLLETLVVPLRAGDLALAARYEAILSRSRHLKLVDLGREVLRGAAALRAATRIKTPDALQISTALLGRCTAFVTNDRRLPAIDGLRVLQLSAYA